MNDENVGNVTNYQNPVDIFYNLPKKDTELRNQVSIRKEGLGVFPAKLLFSAAKHAPYSLILMTD